MTLLPTVCPHQASAGASLAVHQFTITNLFEYSEVSMQKSCANNSYLYYTVSKKHPRHFLP